MSEPFEKVERVTNHLRGTIWVRVEDYDRLLAAYRAVVPLRCKCGHAEIQHVGSMCIVNIPIDGEVRGCPCSSFTPAL